MDEGLERLLGVVHAARAWSAWRNEAERAGVFGYTLERDRLERALDDALAALASASNSTGAQPRQPVKASDAEMVVPLCAWCKRTRGPDGRWVSIEHYLDQAYGLAVSHSLCGSCAQDVEPALARGRAR